MGKEGRQAARCSDFAFARFRFLKRVLLVHGHYYYIRVAMLVQYSFYKVSDTCSASAGCCRGQVLKTFVLFLFQNLAFITPQLYFVFYAWFSPQVRDFSWFFLTTSWKWFIKVSYGGLENVFPLSFHQPLYDSMFLTYYNILFTSAPILVYGLFEQNISQTELMEHPEHYK